MNARLNGHDRYAQSALDAECTKLANTSNGRNDATNRSAFALGQLVGAGALERVDVEQRLFEAATANGHVAKHGPSGTRATIASGLGKGEREPRSIPEPTRSNGAARPKPQPTGRPQVPPSPAVTLRDVPLPAWTEPDEKGMPSFIGIGLEQPKPLKGEIRRHLYHRDGQTVRVKVKIEGGAWRNTYQVVRPSDGAIGWQFRQPAGFVPAPYLGPAGAIDGFDPELLYETLWWVEGEKDVDALQQAGLASFTFGSASDVPDCRELLHGRDVVVVGDHDEAGEKGIARKVEMARGVAARVRVIRFPDLPVGGDASDFIKAGGTAEALLERAEDVEAEVPTEAASEQDRFDTAGPGEVFGDPQTTLQTTEPPFEIPSRPFVWRDPQTFPRRDWIYGKHLVRKFISCTVAQGGVGKSSLEGAEAVAMCTGRPLLGISVQAPLRVWMINLEDPLEEIERRITAILIHFNIDPAELGGRLHLTSGRDTKIIVASTTKAGTVIAQPVVDAFKAKIRKERIDVVMVDPLVKAHRVPENDNGAIDMVCTEFAGIADECGCAFDLVHHVRKTNGAEVTVEDSRGAVALLAASRSARALNRMTSEEAERAGIAEPRFFFRADNGKANLAPPDKTAWFQLRDTTLGNGDPDLPFDNGDRVGVAEPWTWPDALASVTVVDLIAVQKLVNGAKWRENAQAVDWVGKAVAQVMSLNLENKPDKARITGMLRTWFASGALRKVRADDQKGNERTFVEVGTWATV